MCLVADDEVHVVDEVVGDVSRAQLRGQFLPASALATGRHSGISASLPLGVAHARSKVVETDLLWLN